jgi:hypothetical protein
MAIGRALSTLLYQVPPIDPVAFAGSALVFAALVMATGAAAAYKASNVEPNVALKDE